MEALKLKTETLQAQLHELQTVAGSKDKTLSKVRSESETIRTDLVAQKKKRDELEIELNDLQTRLKGGKRNSA